MTSIAESPFLETALKSQTQRDRWYWIDRYRQVRSFSEELCQPLEIEDYVIQSMPDASPTKWHLAHTSWFFDTFVLQAAHADRLEQCPPKYGYLFNSYYNAVGPMHCRPRRGMISRPTVEQTYRYRREVDELMFETISHLSASVWEKFEPIVELGLHHEQQHQELLLTDIKHLFSQNPLHPIYRRASPHDMAGTGPPLEWLEFPGGLHWIGQGEKGFSFDNEGPRHQEFLSPFQLASRLVTNAEYIEFIEEGGYARPELWLSLGWFTVNENKWSCPLYWAKQDDRWHDYTLSGFRPIAPEEPVCHLSFFEADAYARWASARLPTEAEWELASGEAPLKGNFVENGSYHPRPSGGDRASKPLAQMFGDVWEWTRSAYSPYPGYNPPTGAIGEYNGKFMCNQYVLRGGSCATSQTHIRRTYRNFFPPDKRWQFTGIRLARDPI